MSRPSLCRPLWLFLCLAGIAAGAAAPGYAADEPDKAAVPASPAKPATDRLAPPEIVKPVIPSKSEMAESAFKKLDATGKGYVTMEDTRGLDGFDRAFRVADSGHTGKLDFRQFKKAWAEYSGYKE